jgi:hypothetical protein
LSQRLGMNGNAAAKDHFAALPAGNRAMPTTIDDTPPRDHIADRVLPSPSVRMRSSHMMAFGNDSGANQIIQLLHVSS